LDQKAQKRNIKKLARDSSLASFFATRLTDPSFDESFGPVGVEQIQCLRSDLSGSVPHRERAIVLRDEARQMIPNFFIF
jgi:hypothetical protein